MDWVVSKKKPDFVGKRSFSRVDTARPDRKQLVGLLPEDGTTLLPEGAHLIGTPEVPAPPVPALGHVTSSYPSAALGRTFALALVKGGRDLIGRRLYAPLGDRVVQVSVTSHVLYDPEGTRRDGVDGGWTAVVAPLAGGRTSPLAGWAGITGPRLRAAEVPFRTQVNVRVAAKGPAIDAIGAALGVPLPVEPGTTARSGDLLVLWLGPDEWLVSAGPDEVLEDRLRAAAGTEPVSIVDVSAHRTTLLVEGADALAVLAHGCPLDLHPSVFGVGRCAQGTLARAEVTLVRVAEQSFWVLARASFAGHLAGWLEDASVEYR